MWLIYPVFIAGVLIIFIYLHGLCKKQDEENIMEDIPVINVSRENLEKHAAEISSYYSDVRKSNCRRKLLKSLHQSYRNILKGYEYFDRDASDRREMAPAAEWVLDNLYLIEKEYKDITHNMPSSYYKDLPVISKGIMRGYPRIYHIAAEMISHTDGRIDEDVIGIFINSYQKNTALTTGELWALPLMIRIALIQSISRNVERVIYSQEEKKKGGKIGDRLINAIEQGNLDEEINKLSGINKKYSSSFMERLLKVLRDNGIDNKLIDQWIDDRLQLQQSSAEKVINLEHQKQASFQLSMGNCVTGLREIEALNWRDSFERLSYVEKILEEDPSHVYNNMDFESRDYYRHRIEKFSKLLNVSEAYIAGKAVECARENMEATENPDDYRSHVGYYIIDSGVEELKRKISHRNISKAAFNKENINKRVTYYISFIIAATVLLDILLSFYNASFSTKKSSIECFLTFFICFIPCSEIIISTLNWSINKLVKPRFVPKLQFNEEIPPEYTTIVIIPTIINNPERAHSLVESMEIYYLANQEKNLYFALLGDFADSRTENTSIDEAVTEAALRDIESLNNKYCKDGENIFYFLCRKRQYNTSEEKWLGWERKRGKIEEFNSLLLGNNNTGYNVISSNIKALRKAKYVITLDADTQLPRDSAKRLIGAMAHILNRPVTDPVNNKVIRGYGLMQPRISVGTLSANRTLFSKVFSGETGIDMYTLAISDVYQDLFGEGIFTGKGIYDIGVFYNVLKGEIAENTVLSHDLLEGSFARTALVSDIELIDGYPAYYNSSSMRLHRWVRGDWQLVPYIIRSSKLNRLSRWKMIDNLRRSLLSPSIIILIISALAASHNIEKWTALAFIALLCPLLFDVSDAVVVPSKGISLTGKINNFKTVLEQVFLIFCFLPYQAYLMLDAIIRTLYRMIFSRKKLLEWQTAADVEAKLGKKLSNFIGSMWVESAVSVIILILSFNRSLRAGLLLLPTCVLWFISPFIAYFISRETKPHYMKLPEESIQNIRKLARRTWAYFEDFVSRKDNFLAPDNYQEEPYKGIAHRTSPTNMAMGITSGIAAYDLGYIEILELIERTDNIITSMESLSRIKGHFYNWYDTLTREPLHPRYVSTVDSGNLAGYLMVATQALEEFRQDAAISRTMAQGLTDTILLAEEEIRLSKVPDFSYSDVLRDLKGKSFDAVSCKKLLMDILEKSQELERFNNARALYWNLRLRHMINRYLRSIQKLFPWYDVIMEAPDGMEDIREKLKCISSDTAIAGMCGEYDHVIGELSEKNLNDPDERDWCSRLILSIHQSKNEVSKLIYKMDNLGSRLTNMAEAMDFTLVYDKKRQLFSIGYDVEREDISNCYYDLLASEARQASFIAIAKGDVEQKHWFKLSRAMTIMGKSKGLVSWSGTMFEYFMPLLIMRNYPDTLLNTTYSSVIEGQKKYCRDRRVPWGISESGFYSFDLNSVYQYKAFGVPGIGLKRGLNNELVISPYSTILAMQADMTGAYENIERLESEGLLGRYGFYDAVDYTKERMQKSKKKSVIRCFMVHHEGMSFMAIDNVINNFIMQERFHRVPEVKATELLLQERIPRAVVYSREQQFKVSNEISEKQNIIVRQFNTARSGIPEVQLMSNGSYSMMISNSGSGYSKIDNMTVYRWKEDVTTEEEGWFFYIKNLNSSEYWSAAYEPCKNEGDTYEVFFSLDKAEIKRRDGTLSTKMEAAISNEDNAEIRRISITNHGEHSRTVEITSYSEITLAPYTADLVHPVFSNLFIQTEYIENTGCLVASRRPRTKGDKKPWIMQVTAVDGDASGTIQYETNRMNFIGRGRDLTAPQVMEEDAPLKNTTGPVLDPILSIRRRIVIKPGHTCRIAFTIAAADSKEEAIELAQKYKEIQNISRVFELSWTQAQVEMRYLGIKSSQANLYQIMASRLLFINDSMLKRSNAIKEINKFQRNLWGYGISGDIPIVLVTISDIKDIHIVRQMLNAHEYWRIKGLKADLVILNTEETGYIQQLHEALQEQINTSHGRDVQNIQGGIFLFNRSTMPPDDMEFLNAVARLVIDAGEGTLLNQICEVEAACSGENVRNRSCELEEKHNVAEWSLKKYAEEYNEKRKAAEVMENCRLLCRDKNLNGKECDKEQLQFYNGIGGFSPEGDKYIIRLVNHKNTPAPWINVLSNGKFGMQVSESGSAYTWCGNSRENKITPWSNDPVTDKLGEALYLRDNDSDIVWSISPKPLRDDKKYIIEHGFGYSRFKHSVHGISGEETMFVPLNDKIKICIVRLRNDTDMVRNISALYYARMVLGVVPEQTAQYISTHISSDHSFIYAQNPYSEHFGKLKAYLAVTGGYNESFTGNRTEFIGRGGSTETPYALINDKLTDNAGAGTDPCLSEMLNIELNPDEEKKIVIMLGQEENIEDIEEMIRKYSDYNEVNKEYNKVADYWDKILHTITVKTPDESMNLILNGWLMYQTICCRFMSRTAFYQSGGAFGFRDQLQDVLAIGYLEPDITKEQIINSAERQYTEGDVQHWWHPVVNSGIRTRFSDDYLWLPYTVIDYIKNTGDYSILDESCVYLEDEPLKEGEDERYGIVNNKGGEGSIYEHCIRAVDRALKFGSHNIPLMGSGDWNDGMNTVGNKGMGESVWLGWFMYSILKDFKDICRFKGDEEKYSYYDEMEQFLKNNQEENAWDGSWYRRAYFDDGTPLGSAENDECQIDSLSQSWAVISGAAGSGRCRAAMNALEKYLIKEDMGMILLLAPAFNNSFLEPGYIKGYVPGVRENGGQYTHAAVWVILAYTRLGDGDKAWKLYHMINPVNHSRTNFECERYMVEPYVMAADVYSRSPHEGRGGWTWYTGAAGWMYRVGIENILGLKFHYGEGFTIEPCIPEEWNEYAIKYRREKCVYEISVKRGTAKKIAVDGNILSGNMIPFLQEGTHKVEIVI